MQYQKNEIPIIEDDSNTTIYKIPQFVVDNSIILKLPIQYYFKEKPNTIFIPTHLLILSRARGIGIENALIKMDEAARGLRPRRNPISVSRRNDGRYLVLDGNSTTIVAVAAGWRTLPGILDSP
ncbi:hypothetical protein ACFOGJ_18125 [Marinibaculum pumilum]|uniref:Uncharacterized protein n=1 Tax=Marinibaculum pumilum TaxID=1766165 RepID=A0ABV7L3S0_9PROT